MTDADLAELGLVGLRFHWALWKLPPLPGDNWDDFEKSIRGSLRKSETESLGNLLAVLERAFRGQGIAWDRNKLATVIQAITHLYGDGDEWVDAVRAIQQAEDAGCIKHDHVTGYRSAVQPLSPYGEVRPPEKQNLEANGLATKREFAKSKGFTGDDATRLIDRLEKHEKSSGVQLVPVEVGRKAAKGVRPIAAKFRIADLERLFVSANSGAGRKE